MAKGRRGLNSLQMCPEDKGIWHPPPCLLGSWRELQAGLGAGITHPYALLVRWGLARGSHRKVAVAWGEFQPLPEDIYPSVPCSWNAGESDSAKETSARWAQSCGAGVLLLVSPGRLQAQVKSRGFQQNQPLGP